MKKISKIVHEMVEKNQVMIDTSDWKRAWCVVQDPRMSHLHEQIKDVNCKVVDDIKLIEKKGSAMGTRATIKIMEDKEEIYYLYHGHDGYPENILELLQKAVDMDHSNEAGHLASIIIGLSFDENSSSQDIMLTPCFHGDESYKYLVELRKNKWEIEIID